ncbi:hypothetical protein FHR70_001777 [Microvirga lupini]|uniref:TupA-like ATPgrasp n=1 Tax=Microvirga lupini TaxID=420324 RepID=A0A7W4VK83_9HYPH|nr:ATP-grasp fold amidoligase family protein [Microvirga lupini]MBB3018723.1 hypothetical protein [Microvirga lupini]
MTKFADRDFDNSVEGLSAIVQEYNSLQATMSTLSGQLAGHTTSRTDLQRAEHAKAILAELDVNPRMSESLANVMRPTFGYSYRTQRMAAWAISQAARLSPVRYLPQKDIGRQFSQAIGLQLPRMYQEGAPHNLIEIPEAAVVKPLREDGGRAVHGFRRTGSGFSDLFNNKSYSSIDDVRLHLKEHLDIKRVRQDAWIVEEMIVPDSGNPAGSFDLKFFTFYGRVAYVLQVARWRDEGVQRVIFDRDGKAVNASKFYPRPDTDVLPAFTPADIKVAEQVSLEIPWPGARIDFLTSSRGMIFGEFTFNPGAYGGFYKESDSFLGREWAHAAGRLYDDLMAGKEFRAYKELLKSLGNT